MAPHLNFLLDNKVDLIWFDLIWLAEIARLLGGHFEIRIITCIDVWRSVIKVSGWSNFPELRDVNYNAVLLAARGICMYMCTNVYWNLIIHSFYQCKSVYHRDIRQHVPEPVSQSFVFLTGSKGIRFDPTQAKAKWAYFHADKIVLVVRSRYVPTIPHFPRWMVILVCRNQQRWVRTLKAFIVIVARDSRSHCVPVKNTGRGRVRCKRCDVPWRSQRW
jgi:hypothetical protein